MTVAARVMADRKIFGTSVIPNYHTSPVLQLAERDLDPVASFVATRVVPHGRLPLFPAGDAGGYPFFSPLLVAVRWALIYSA